jgi:hypothetical protein
MNDLCKNRVQISNVVSNSCSRNLNFDLDFDVNLSFCIPKNAIWHFRLDHVSSEKGSNFVKISL